MSGEADRKGRGVRNLTSQGALDLRDSGAWNRIGCGTRARQEDTKRSQLQGTSTSNTIDHPQVELEGEC